MEQEKRQTICLSNLQNRNARVWKEVVRLTPEVSLVLVYTRLQKDNKY